MSVHVFKYIFLKQCYKGKPDVFKNTLRSPWYCEQVQVI